MAAAVGHDNDHGRGRWWSQSQWGGGHCHRQPLLPRRPRKIQLVLALATGHTFEEEMAATPAPTTAAVAAMATATDHRLAPTRGGGVSRTCYGHASSAAMAVPPL